MTIGQLAKSAGVRISTLRFYERRGLLRPTARSAAGYRHFTTDDIARIRFLRRGQELGFGLAELGSLLTLSRQRTIHRRDLATAATTKLAELDQRITDLRRMRRAITGLLALPCIDPDMPCPIIASLSTLPAAPTPRRTRTASTKRPARRAHA